MAKRKTKADQLDDLRQRVWDIYLGACGWELGDEDEIDLDAYERVITGAQYAFGIAGDCYLLKTHNAGKFAKPDAAAEFLFEHGVRATNTAERPFSKAEETDGE